VRLFFILAFFVAGMFPLPALACFVAITPVNSQVPVSVKVGDTYFRIPESFVNRLFLRAPAIRDTLVIDNFHFQAAGQKTVNRLQIKIVKKKSFKEDNVVTELPLNQDTIIYVYDRDVDIDQVGGYLKAISSKDKPVDWDEDIRLSDLFEAPIDPCKSVQDRVNSNETKDREYIPDGDVLSALRHKNDAIRAKGFAHVAHMTSPSQEVFSLSLAAAEKDISWPVRSAAIRSVVGWVKQNPNAKELAIERLTIIAENDVENNVRRAAKKALLKINSI